MKQSEFPEVFLKKPFLGRRLGMGVICGLIGVWVLCGGLAWGWPREFGFAYLTVISFFLTISMGALFWVLLHHAVDAAWSVMVRRIWEHLACLLVPLFILSIFLVFNSHIWRPPSFRPLLSPCWSGFWIGLSLGILTGSAVWLRRISVGDDEGGSGAGLSRRITWASIPCYAVGFCLISFLGWMSLQEGWISSIWPVYVFAGSAISSLALSILIVFWLQPNFYGKFNKDHFHLFGKLLFALTLFWGYMAFSQYLIIWYGNLPAETGFFQIRGQGWGLVASWVLIIGHFFLPFLFLLTRFSKTRLNFLAMIAAELLLMHFVDLCWMLLPSSKTNLWWMSISLLMSLAAIGGTLTLVFLYWLGKVPLWPVADHRLEECLSLSDE